MEMANYISGLEGYTVSVVSGYDVLQESGQKIQFLEARDIALSRPNRMRAEERQADGVGSLVLFDGSTVMVWHGDARVYAQADQPGSIDDTLVYFERDLGMRLPLAGLLTTRMPEELRRRVLAIDYVEWTEVLGEAAHHIAGRFANLDFQVWIAYDDRPLPLRIVLTYPDPGLPQYWAQFSAWKENPRLRDSNFSFKLPADARQIPFAVQISMMTDAVSTEGATAEEADQ